MSDEYSDENALFLKNDVKYERHFVSRLISLYRNKPELWDLSHQHHTDKRKRLEAIEDICVDLQAYKPGYTVEDLKKKINILRTNFNKERSKILLSGNKRQPYLWYYEDMRFIVDQGNPSGSAMKTHSNSMQLIQSSSQNTQKRRIELIPRKVIIKKSIPVNTVENRESEDELLTKCWMAKLRRLAPDQRMFAEKIINDTLFEGELGALTRNGVTFNVATPNWVQCQDAETPDFKASSEHDEFEDE